MPGFPTRPNRDAYGPTYEDEVQVENPKREVSAAIGNLYFHQLAGMGVVVPRVTLIADWNGASFDISFIGMAWDPNGAQPAPVIARSGVGEYTVTFLSTYPDQQGTPQAIGLKGASAAVQQSVSGPFHGDAQVTSATVVTVKLYDGSGAGAPALADEEFLLQVW